MKKTFVLFGIFLVLLISGCTTTQEQEKIQKVCFNENCYAVELAETNEQRETGLMGRDHLDNDKGMLFVYGDDRVYTFWMKNTVIPLDMIWIDRDGKVVRIIKNAEPCGKEYCPSINPNKKARYVLEINGGEVDSRGLIEGSKAVFM
jgi:uncharacterized membrane protein (UPF0127 family)